MPEPGDNPLGRAPLLSDAQDVRSRVRSRLFGGDGPGAERARPETFGRFEILGELGRGGMGRVLLARDPALDRRLALKVLRRHRASEEADTRLVREAQALAKLDHANVVTVFETGTVDGETYIAMEHLTGASLADWLAAAVRPWQEVVRVFCDAGRGLAAAHACGLIHRDFKPANVILTEAGVVKVLDFGLARSAMLADTDTATAAAAAPQPEGVNADSGQEASTLTQTGALMGTPAYMAPEQLRGREVDARADQFSFAVALYEALCGDRPFPGNNPAELALNVVEGRRSATPKGLTAPRPLLIALDRALQLDPDARYPSMDAFVAALQRAADAPRRLRTRLGVAAIVLTGATLWALAIPESSAARCSLALDSIAGVWSPETRSRAHRALGERGGAALRGSTLGALDRYVRRWRATAEKACIAQEPIWLPVQQCLALYRDDVARTTEALAAGTPDMLPHAVQLIAGLPSSAACATRTEARSLDAQNNASRRRAELWQARYDALRGRYKAAATVAERIAADVDADPGTRAEALYVLGKSRERQGDVAGARDTMERARATADAAGDDITRARAQIYLVYINGKHLGRVDEARVLADEAEAQLDALDADPLFRADLLHTRGVIERGDRERATALHREALRIRRAALGERHPDTLASMLSLGNTLGAVGEFAEAEPLLRDAVRLASDALGAGHPRTIAATEGLALVLGRSQRFAEAAALQQEVVARRRELHGPRSRRLAAPLLNLGVTLSKAEQHAEALPHLREALALISEGSPDDSPSRLPWLRALGRAELRAGDKAAARELLEQGLAIRQRAGGSAEELGHWQFLLAQAIDAPARPPRATALAELARAAFESAGDADATAEVSAWLGAR